ncbi:hypothetical protein GGR57DRAFT_476090 [Xylariaceae sp. FL1272]|nr:hypothetical protein GGR57DRAFT_476090 [Xylariaceae sp. FL1272]
MATPEVSHGRGGAGNINPDDTKYVDGEIVRQGDEGSHNDGPHSTGRGGAANIADKETPVAPRSDADFVPTEAIRASLDEDHHTGRGGAANIQLSDKHAAERGLSQTGAKNPNQGLADKLKDKLFGAFKK